MKPKIHTIPFKEFISFPLELYRRETLYNYTITYYKRGPVYTFDIHNDAHDAEHLHMLGYVELSDTEFIARGELYLLLKMESES
jgi:hypothetical protein